MKNPTNKEEPSRPIGKHYFEILDTFLRTDTTKKEIFRLFPSLLLWKNVENSRENIKIDFNQLCLVL